VCPWRYIPKSKLLRKIPSWCVDLLIFIVTSSCHAMHFVCVGSEFTTMAGRRLRDAVKEVLTSDSSGEFNDIHVVLAGLTNTYSQYITTFEEYQIQRYEVCIFPGHLFRLRT